MWYCHDATDDYDDRIVYWTTVEKPAAKPLDIKLRLYIPNLGPRKDYENFVSFMNTGQDPVKLKEPAWLYETFMSGAPIAGLIDEIIDLYPEMDVLHEIYRQGVTYVDHRTHNELTPSAGAI